MTFTNARATDPSESAAAFDPDHSRIVVEAIGWLYTLGPASDENMVARYKAHQSVRPEWPSVADESIRKRCSDARRLDKRIQKVGTTKSSHGKTVGRYGYVEAVAA